MPELTTQLIHHPYQAPAGFVAPQPGVFKASTVVFANVAAMRSGDWKTKSGYTYGLHGTPTTFTLEQRLCTLEGAKHCVLVPSGLAAISAVNLALLRAGDELLLPDNIYGPSKALAENELRAWGITTVVYDPMNPQDLAAKLSPRSRLVWLEAPGSVSMEFPDLPALISLSKAAGVYTALDNTWGAGLAFAPFEQGVDMSVQALTKYPSGGGDVLMGSVMTCDEALSRAIDATHRRLGFGVGANDAEAVLRALPSIALRYQAHDQAARELASWLASRAEIAQVLHPALPGSPGHENWRAVCTTGLAAGLFSVVFDARYSSTQIDRFCDSLQRFKLGYSWGGPMSLAVPYHMASLRQRWLKAGVLVRFSVGLEAVADLQADLAQALAVL